jgi:hypothetical protein
MTSASVIRFIVLFGIGAVFGALIGFRAVIGVNDPLWFFGGVALGAVVVGMLSYGFGRRFWERIRWLR